MISLDAVWPLVVAALMSACMMPVAISLRPSANASPIGVQDLHVTPTSRLGGAIVFLAFAGGVIAAILLHLAPARPLIALVACAIPVVAAGLWEDVTRRLTPMHRLIAGAAAALLACMIADGVTARLDIPIVDGWLQTVPLFAIGLTCFMAVGACNAVNIIDGAHGLASGTAILMFAGIAIVAMHVGDQFVLVQALAIEGALIGFLLWNYPAGRIFLGDGGAYLIGFIYAELSIQIVARNPHVSAWFVIMLASYAIVETVFSMYRRMVILRKPSMQPDLLHLHSLVFKAMARPAERSGGEISMERANRKVAPPLWVHGLFCLAVALTFHDNTPALLAGIVAYCFIYGFHYRSLWKHRDEAMSMESEAAQPTSSFPA